LDEVSGYLKQQLWGVIAPFLEVVMNYQQFIESKRHTSGNFGFEPVFMPELFDFQKEVVTRAVNKGRMGIFADTGLGKTRMSLTIAQNIVQKTNGRVLILTPLAVAFQFIDEAEKIGVSDIEHSKNGKFTKKNNLPHLTHEKAARS
jgi:superfamily II DNA or RNA helicase